MMEDKIKELIGKRVYVILTTGRKYSGIINSFANGLIQLTDKFGDLVMFNISEISSLEVEK